jgi:hypothetical protein
LEVSRAVLEREGERTCVRAIYGFPWNPFTGGGGDGWPGLVWAWAHERVLVGTPNSAAARGTIRCE